MNFQRSYTREIIEIANRISTNRLPKPHHLSFRYSGDPTNIGSHIFSIVMTLFPDDYHLIFKDGHGSCSIYSDTYSAKILIERVEGFKGNIFEFSLLSTNQQIIYSSTSGKLTHRKLEKQKFYENEMTLEPFGSVSNLHEEMALREVYHQIQEYFISNKDPLLDLKHGLTNILLVEKFLECS